MNLELIETDALIQELLGRFDHAVFGGVKVRPHDDDNGEVFESLRFRGNSHTCMGLAGRLLCEKNADLERRWKECDDDTPGEVK